MVWTWVLTCPILAPVRSELPTGTVTLLFTDVEGSTRLLRELGAQAYADLLGEHRRLVRQTSAEFAGAVVDAQGDASFVAFPTAFGAVDAARAIRERLAPGPIRLRMGIHTGAPLLTDEGYVGPDVHCCARIAAAAHGAQIVVSKATRDLIQDRVVALDLGQHRLRDFEESVSLFQVGHGAFPPLRTLSSSNIPRLTSSFVGRQRELAELTARLERGARLVTLTGPGGIGKTRLALEVAASLANAYSGGTFWVGLSELRDSTLVIDAISRTIGARGPIAEHIGNRTMLLLLDNFEQVIAVAPELVSLLTLCPNLSLLVTSRESLRVQGEIEYDVPPLAAREAVSLFCDRAQTAHTDVIEVLCARLDELPLAIELAAARAKVLSPTQILQRIAQRLDLFAGYRDAIARQVTLRATMDWSFQLLTEEERGLFGRLSVFAGGCDLDMAERVVGATVDLLQSLVDKNLIRRSNERYWMLETIHTYASERLQAEADADGLRRKHAMFFLALAEETTTGARGQVEIALLRANIDNFRVALTWLRSCGESDTELRLAVSLFDLWVIGGFAKEGRRVVDAALATIPLESSELRARALKTAGELALDDGDFASANSLLQQAVDLYELQSQDRAVASCLSDLGHVAKCEGQYERAQGLFERSIDLARRNNAKSVLANSLLNLGDCLISRGDFAKAEVVSKESLKLILEIGDTFEAGVCLFTLGLASLLQHRNDEALDLLKQSLGTFREFDYAAGIGYSLDGLAALACSSGEAIAATRLLGAANVLFANAGIAREPFEQAMHEQTVASIGARLGTQQLSDLVADAEARDLDESIRFALGVKNPTGFGAR